jgi:sugar phosphate isomerase/epimerase
MKLSYGKSKWEMWSDPLETFLQRVKSDGFEAAEIYLQTLSEEPARISDLHDKYGLQLIGQVLTHGQSFEDHLRSLEAQVAFALQCKPVLINCHAGRDIFKFEENLQIFKRLVELSQDNGISILVETHRGRPTYSAIETCKYLEALPSLELAADFSHWMVVHESDLSDQVENIDLAISRSLYIHARVGYSEGPQIPDPRAPEWENEVKNHLRLWQKIVDRHNQEGREKLYITPEFGPPAYMHTLPFTNQPVGDVWEINVYMKEMLKKTLVN